MFCMIVIWCYIYIYGVIVCCVWIMLNSTYWYSGKNEQKMKVLVFTTSVHPSNVGPPKGGQQKCLAEKNVLNCFKEPLFCSFWMTNIFFWGGTASWGFTNGKSIHHSQFKKNIDLEFPYCVYIFTYNKKTITYINPCEGVVRMMGNPDDGWWWDVIDKQKLMTRRHLISFLTAI